MLESIYVPDTGKIEQSLSPERDFPLRPEGANVRYALCSSPRSGSSLVAAMLHATSLAGDPLEYLNNKWIGFQTGSNSATDANFDVERYLADWEKRRTSPNGMFGIKLHYSQMRRVWRGKEEAAARYLAAYDHRILLTRRDKVAQAVSLHRALATQVWSSRDMRHAAKDARDEVGEVGFDAVRIAELMVLLLKEEERWRDFLQTHRLTFSEFCYEDFVCDYADQSARLIKLLGIDRLVKTIPPPQLKRQGSNDDPLIGQFRQAIGLGAAPAKSGMEH